MYSFPKPIVIVDLETTGGNPVYQRIIEVGIIRIEPTGKISTYSTLVNPDKTVSAMILSLTGIRQEDLDRAPLFGEVAKEVGSLLEDALFVAHNARFDYGFLKHEFARLERLFTATTLCSARFSKALYPEYRRHDLSSIIERFDLSITSRHRALDDAKAVQDFFEKAYAEDPQKFEEAFLKMAATRRAQSHVPEEIFRTLPESCGVYVFHGESNEILYIGKSRNIKDRVMSHFYEDHQSQKELAITQKVHHIQTYETISELAALILESDLIKQHSSIYNRRLRAKKLLAVWIKDIDAKGFFTIRIEWTDRVEPSGKEQVLKIFKTLKKAKNELHVLAEDNGLCLKILGLENSKGACFFYHLKKCKGACMGQETAIFHNVRFIQAFKEPAIKTWPFDGAVMIHETNALAKKSEAFVVDNWRILSRIGYSEAGTETVELNRPFDLDTYKILASAIEQKRSNTSIKFIKAE